MKSPDPGDAAGRGGCLRARRPGRGGAERPHALLVPALLCVLLAAGCAGSRESVRYPAGSSSGGPPRRGGHALFVREGDQDYLDPALSYETYSSPVVEGLFRTLLEKVSKESAGSR